MSPKEIAVQLRRLASAYDDMVVDDLVKLAEEIYPPKPQRPEPGTVVRLANGDLGITYSGGVAWVNPAEVLITNHWYSEAAQLCTPVRILADDEVAVKRSAIQALLGEVGE